LHPSHRGVELLLDPRRALAIGRLDAENNPRGSRYSSTPAFLDSPMHPSPRRVELMLDPRKPSIVVTLDVRRSPWVEQ
jgi:hypothetical protein